MLYVVHCPPSRHDRSLPSVTSSKPLATGPRKGTCGYRPLFGRRHYRAETILAGPRAMAGAKRYARASSGRPTSSATRARAPQSMIASTSARCSEPALWQSSPARRSMATTRADGGPLRWTPATTRTSPPGNTRMWPCRAHPPPGTGPSVQAAAV